MAVPICVVKVPGVMPGQSIATKAENWRTSRPLALTVSFTERLPALPRYAPASSASVSQPFAARTGTWRSEELTVSSPITAVSRRRCVPFGRTAIASPCSPSAVAVPTVFQAGAGPALQPHLRTVRDAGQRQPERDRVADERARRGGRADRHLRRRLDHEAQDRPDLVARRAARCRGARPASSRCPASPAAAGASRPAPSRRRRRPAAGRTGSRRCPAPPGRRGGRRGRPSSSARTTRRTRS